MKKLHMLAVLALIAVAPAALATPRVVEWQDSTNTDVAPYATLPSGGVMFVDWNTGLVWMLQGITTTTPSAVASGGVVGQYYTTANCTGSVYFGVLNTDIPGQVYVFGNGSGALVAAGSGPQTITAFYSEWKSGSCAVGYTPVGASYIVYLASTPPTPPTLPAGPYHLSSHL